MVRVFLFLKDLKKMNGNFKFNRKDYALTFSPEVQEHPDEYCLALRTLATNNYSVTLKELAKDFEFLKQTYRGTEYIVEVKAKGLPTDYEEKFICEGASAGPSHMVLSYKNSEIVPCGAYSVDWTTGEISCVKGYTNDRMITQKVIVTDADSIESQYIAYNIIDESKLPLCDQVLRAKDEKAAENITKARMQERYPVLKTMALGSLPQAVKTKIRNDIELQKI